jgi:predicted ester cyclase
LYEVANKAVVRRFYEQGVNRGDLAVVHELVMPGAVDHNPVVEAISDSPHAVHHGVQMLLMSFPDLNVAVEDLLAEDDKVVARITLSASKPGSPQLRRTSWSAIQVFRLRAGRIVETWGVADRFSLLGQLGMLDGPRPQAPGVRISTIGSRRAPGALAGTTGLTGATGAMR